MRGPFLLCRLAFVLLVAALPVKAQEGSGVLSLDAVLDWDAGGLTPRAYESRFPLGLGEDPRFRSTSQGGYSYDEAAGEGEGQIRLLGDFRVVRAFAIVREEKVTQVAVYLAQPSGETVELQAVVEALNRHMPTPAQNGGVMAFGNNGVRKPIFKWVKPHVMVMAVQHIDGPVMVLMHPADAAGKPLPPTSPRPIPPQMAQQNGAMQTSADLDFLLNFAELWNLTGTGLEKMYVPRSDDSTGKTPQFEWLNAAKDRARFARRLASNLEVKLTLFGGSVRAEEAILEFVDGRVARVTVSLYNRGDSGEISAAAFDLIYRKVGQNLGQVLKVAPRSQGGASNAALNVVSWNWTTANGVALLEQNASDLGGLQPRPEFLRLKMAAPNQSDWSMGRLAVGVQRMSLINNVIRDASGDVYISGVPMVDQGAKGYCVAASCQRLFEYMQIPCDQHEMARLIDVDAEKGANIFEMQKSLAEVDSHFRVAFKPLVNPQQYYSRGKRRVSLKEFAGLVKEYAEKGEPLLWALILGRFQEDPPLPLAGQVSGGHMRLVIGYNAKTDQVLFTDSWGAGHELKRMNLADAYEATVGLFSMAPRGL